jgi:hypothetical protein
LRIAGRFTGQISKHIPGGTMGLVVSAISRVGSIATRPTSIAVIAALLFDIVMLGAPVGGEVSDASAPPTLRELPYVLLYEILQTPAFWLAIGVCLLVLLASVKSPRRSARREAALALVMSGLLYTCAYLIIGLATDVRYQFWSMVATFTALVISLSGLRMQASPPQLRKLRRDDAPIRYLAPEDADVARKGVHADDEFRCDFRIVIGKVAADQLGDQGRRRSDENPCARACGEAGPG